MKLASSLFSGLAVLTVTNGLSPIAATAAASFGQQEVSQSNYVVMAAPRANNAYNLLVLEQVSTQKECWKTRNDAIGSIEPLLLNFDFTGICGRSTDSNGYSIRMGQEDLGLKYSMRLVPRNGYVALIGTPSVRTMPELEIGRTKAIAQDYLKIDLNPGWRLSRRTFDGKTLGHVYVTNDSTLAAYASTLPAKPASPIVVKPTTPATPVVIKPTTPATPVVIKPTTPATPVVVKPTTPAAPVASTNPRYNDLNRVYQEILGRAIDAEALAHYSAKMDKKRWSLDKVRQDIAKSDEGRRVAINRSFRELVRRDATVAEADLYLGKMKKRNWNIDRVRREISRTAQAPAAR
jgi:hypothetical protein